MRACAQCGYESPVEQKFCGECGARTTAAAVAQERKTVTALFCDLVGSTQLGERLDPEVMADLLGEYQQICRRVVEAHGGVVEKFIGDAVVAVFGVPAAHEDDPERAVRTGLRLVAEIAASELGVEVRVGIDTGEVLVRQDVDPGSGVGFVTGDAMNTAARLQSAAPPMGVVVGESTRVSTGAVIVFEALSPIEAKGKAEPVQAWLAVQPMAQVGAPERDRSPFVGRELELGMLTQLFERSRTRSSVEFVTLVGEAGLGKSRLVRELARYVEDLPDLVVWREGRCLPYGEGVAFWPLSEIVRTQAGILDTDDQAALAMKLDAAVTEPDPQLKSWMVDRLAPLVGLATSTQPPQQEETFAAWRGFIESLTSRGSAVWVVEDLHWADPAFVSFLEDLATQTAGVPLLVVVTARPEVEERHPGWPPGRRSTVLPLSPLADDEVQALVAAALGDAPAGLLDVVLARAGGSPLFAEQLAQLATEENLPAAAGAESADEVPATVQALIAARIDTLPPEAKSALLQASVVGRTFWSGVLRAFAEHRAVEQPLTELSRRELIRTINPSTMTGQGEYRFWHGLVQDVAYHQVTRAERGQLHAISARWLADTKSGVLGESAQMVVSHFDAATSYGASLDRESEQLLTSALLEAGLAALRTQIDRAIPLLTRALERLDHASEDYRTAVAHLGEAHLLRGDVVEALPLLEEATQLALEAGDYLGAVQAADACASAHVELGDVQRVAPTLTAIESALPPTSREARVEMAALRASFQDAEGTPEKTLEMAERCRTLAQEFGVPVPAAARAELAFPGVAAGDVQCESQLRDIYVELLSNGKVASALVTLHNFGVVLNGASPAKAVEVLAELTDVARKLGAQSDSFEARAGLASAYVAVGRLHEASEHADACLEWAARSNSSRVLITGRHVKCGLALLRGDEVQDPAEGLETCLELGFVMGAISHMKVLLSAGDKNEIEGAAAEILPRFLAESRHEAVPVLLASGNLAGARQLASTPSSPGRYRWARWQLGQAQVAEHDDDREQAASRYEAAAAAAGEMGALVLQADATEGLGRALVGLDVAERGRAATLEARELWRGMGAVRRVRELDVANREV